EKYSTNPRRARNALEKAKFKCELNPNHVTFTNKISKKQYMEAHHLIPMSKQGSLEFDIDVPENILCLCPTCHRKMHLAQDDDKKELLTEAFKNRKRVCTLANNFRGIRNSVTASNRLNSKVLI
ncbi:MAG TPA: HNH endonuclease signature motif containing protein, partial [Balneolales bacterium]|nr:HNH endonuclease signature motif containing protein [Balneolales bacterium]